MRRRLRGLGLRGVIPPGFKPRGGVKLLALAALHKKGVWNPTSCEKTVDSAQAQGSRHLFCAKPPWHRCCSNCHFIVSQSPGHRMTGALSGSRSRVPTCQAKKGVPYDISNELP